MLRYLCLSLVCIVLTSLADVAKTVAADARPNVVLILSDDQAWTDYSFMGHETVRTPALDRLAAESVTYTRGYVPTSLCRPSLMTLATGRFAHAHGVSGNDPARVDATGARIAPDDYAALRARLTSQIARFETLPSLLSEAGYVSHQSGKWWEGSAQHGGFTQGMTHGDPARGGRHGDVGLKIGRQGMTPVMDFIDRAVADEKPFFVWYAPFLPHTPHNPPQRLLDKYLAPGRPIALSKYYANCAWFDETCGELLEHIESRGVAENTLVVYVTDNGWIQRTPETDVPAGWRHSFAPRSKQSPYDGGVRTPIMLKWLGRIEPRRDDATLVSSIDLMPTILAACGVDVPEDLPGVDLLPNAVSAAAVDRDTIFGEGFAHDVADIDNPVESLLYRWCIEGRWKLILSYDGKVGRYGACHASRGGPQLFDLAADPLETTNVASAHPEIVQRLKAKIDAWYAVPEEMEIEE